VAGLSKLNSVKRSRKARGRSRPAEVDVCSRRASISDGRSHRRAWQPRPKR